MRTGMRLLVLLVVPAWLAGCEGMSWGPVAPPQAAGQAGAAQPTGQEPGEPKYLAGLTVQEAEGSPGRGAVAAAQEARERYLKATEELLASQKDNAKLTEENRKLLAQMARLQMQLEQSQKELAEANETIIDLNRDLREWKGNVLGFRSEMQQALQAMLEGQKKMLILLGGEVGQPKANAGGEQAVSPKDAAGGLSKRSNS